VPDALEGLFIVSAGTRGVADDSRVEPAITGERYAERHELGSSVPGVPAQLGSGQAVAVVPLDRAGQPIGRGLYWRVAIAAVENQGLDVLSQVDQAVYVGWNTLSG